MSAQSLWGSLDVGPDLLARHDRPTPRYTSYPTALEFSTEVDRTVYEARLAYAGYRSAGPISLYVHVPFCAARCSFCACHVVVTSNRSITGGYLDRLGKEAALVADRLGSRMRISQYHWGGGTPTFYPPEMLAELHGTLLESFELEPTAEMAVEVDPRVTTSEHLEMLARLGFNRLSIGVQDLDPEVQALIGRNQTVRQTAELMEVARDLGFASVNLDLVYGLPGQTVATFERTLEQVIKWQPERLATYSFAHIPETRRHQRRIDASLLPDRDGKFALLASIITRLTTAGYIQVGMDHFALPDDDLARAEADATLTRNFMGYTTARSTDVIALGTSGISDVAGVYAQNHRRLASYQSDVDAGKVPTERGAVLSLDDLIRRHVIKRIMCVGRVDLEDVGRQFGIDAEDYLAAELDELHGPEGLIAEGLASVSGGEVAATDLGRLFVRRLAAVFDAYVNRRSDRAQFSRVV